jgi:hypothetical protein
MESWLEQPLLLLSDKLPWCSVPSVARLFLILGIVWSLVERSVVPILVMFTAAVLMTMFLKPQQKMMGNFYRQEAQHSAPQYQMRQSAQQQQYSQQPAYLSNPMPLGDYRSAVRSVRPMIEPQHEDYMRRMYSQVDVLPVELMLNPIPDPTLQARYPTWWQSSEIDRSIVQDQGNMRYIR